MVNRIKTDNAYYPDIPLFLILIPFISAFNYYLTYSNIQLNGFLLLTFTIDTVQGYLAWWGVRGFILYLDRIWPYQKGLLKRLGLQLSGSLLIGLAIISVLTEAVSWLFRGRPAALDFYTHDLWIIGIWFFVVNGIYTGLYFYNEWQKAEAGREQLSGEPQGGLMIKYGRKQLLLDFAELAGIYVEDQHVIACSQAGKNFYLDESLDQIEKKLPRRHFFRLNRQYLLHRNLILGFKRAENGKIVVLVKEQEAFPAEIPVSRTKAPAFKSWFRPD